MLGAQGSRVGGVADRADAGQLHHARPLPRALHPFGRPQLEGVDVPYAFDGGITATVIRPRHDRRFMLVRNQAKMEAPLSALAINGLVISMIAEVTFYGHDQTGRTVSAVGNIGISFANFGDPG